VRILRHKTRHREASKAVTGAQSDTAEGYAEIRVERRGNAVPPLSDLSDGKQNIYVFDDDDDEAQAFDDFYNTYDKGHVRTRRFLLG